MQSALVILNVFHFRKLQYAVMNYEIHYEEFQEILNK